MKTVKQITEVSYHAVDFKDAIKMFPLMNQLQNYINKIYKYEDWCNLGWENQKKYRDIKGFNSPNMPEIHMGASEFKTVLNIFEILTKLGFVADVDEDIEELELPELPIDQPVEK